MERSASNQSLVRFTAPLDFVGDSSFNIHMGNFKKFAVRSLCFSILLLPTSPAWAYKTSIHYYLTYLAAYECDLKQDASAIALSAYSVDKFEETNAGTHVNQWLNPSEEETRRVFHFPVAKSSGDEHVIRNSAEAWKSVNFSLEHANDDMGVVYLGIAIHTLQDSFSHEGFTPKFGHWNSGPDLPETDPEKLVQAAKATYTAVNAYSELRYHQSCEVSFESLASSFDAWARIPAKNNNALIKLWKGIAEGIAHTDVSPEALFNLPNFKKIFENTAVEIRAGRDLPHPGVTQL